MLGRIISLLDTGLRTNQSKGKERPQNDYNIQKNNLFIYEVSESGVSYTHLHPGYGEVQNHVTRPQNKNVYLIKSFDYTNFKKLARVEVRRYVLVTWG